MTREEAAIKSCEDRIKHLKSAPTHHYGKRQRERAIELEKVKIKALRPVSREQVEKVWRGGWIAVRESEITGFNPELAGCDPIGGYKCSRCKAEAVLDCNDEFVLDNFCPHCGVPMTDEAVEMVLERMEAMEDGKGD